VRSHLIFRRRQRCETYYSFCPWYEYPPFGNEEEEGKMIPRALPRHRQTILAAGVMLTVLAAGACSSTTSPAQPTAATAGRLDQFGPLVGTNWTGTASFGASGGASAVQVSLIFMWGGVCNNPPWCETGYNPYGLGTVDAVRTRILGSPDWVAVGQFRREIYVGENPVLGTGHWDSVTLSTDRRRLVITSSDFEWGQRRGVTFELTRAPWPAGLLCPDFVPCNF
jgi:hypothetical protein